MKLSWAIVLLLAAAPTAWGADYVVDSAYTGAAGANNTFATLSAAIAAIPAAGPNRVLIHPGKYQQQLTITQNDLTLVGTGEHPGDTVITDNLNAQTPKPGGGGNYGTTGASSTFIKGNGVTAENLTFENSTPLGGSQAVAIKTSADRIAFRNCVFTSFQDTLYVTGGRDYFRDCTINGSVDFIFGNATAVFDHCTIVSSHPGAVTAANTQAGTAVGMVFLDCTLTKAADLQDNSVSLGRPWQYGMTDACVVFIRCKMDSHIRAAGWNPWDARNTNPAGDSRYGEFASTDMDGKPLDVSKRVAWSHQLTVDQAAQFTPANIFGPADFWWKGGWPAVWGTRNHPPAAYTDWKPGGTWDVAGLTTEPAQH
jgi:pectinesterase